MNTKSVLKIGIVLLCLTVLLAGCTQQSTTPIQPPSGGTPVTTADTSGDIASELGEGTGTGSGDITSDDLDQMQSDLDEIEQNSDSLSESNV